MACVISFGACKNTGDPTESTGSIAASNQTTENNGQTTESTGASADSTTGASAEATAGSDSNNASGGEINTKPSVDTTDSNMPLPTDTDWKEDGVLKILTIGNSFSVDCMQFVYEIAQAAGVEKVKLGNLYISGCSLEKHLTNAKSDAKAYTF